MRDFDRRHDTPRKGWECPGQSRDYVAGTAWTQKEAFVMRWKEQKRQRASIVGRKFSCIALVICPCARPLTLRWRAKPGPTGSLGTQRLCYREPGETAKRRSSSGPRFVADREH